MSYYLIPRGRVVLEKARLCMRKSQVLRGQISTLRGERFRARFIECRESLFHRISQF